MLGSEQKSPFWSRPSFAIILLSVIAFVLNGPFLKGGYSLDDIVIYNLFQRAQVSYSHLKGAWSVFDSSSFSSVWWIDSETASHSGGRSRAL